MEIVDILPHPTVGNPFEMYGNKSVFEKNLKRGFTEANFGVGGWVEYQEASSIMQIVYKRFVGVWAFHHPEGKIATYENPKIRSSLTGTVRCHTIQNKFTLDAFQDYLQENEITFGEKFNLAAFVKNWDYFESLKNTSLQ